MEQSPQNSSLAVPIAIIFGFGLVALAVYFSGIGRGATVSQTATSSEQTVTYGEIKPVDKSDYIKGNPNAPILIVEYSDYDCPYCKNFHETMTQIMNDYGVSGKVGWVYRQFPIVELHPNSPRISEAALCVGEIGGNDAFWKFSDRVFQERGVTDTTNIVLLPEYAEKAGVDKVAFSSCLESGRQKQNLSKSIEEGVASGLKEKGTPHSYVIIGNQKASINGAQPYEVVKQIIDNLLGQLQGVTQTPSSTPPQN